jgi:hypothetical protein
MSRPRGLILVVILEVLVGLLSLLGGITALFLHNLPQAQGLGFLQILAPVLPLVEISLGIFFLILSYGLWRGYRWAWMLTIIFEIVHIIADIGFIASRSFALDKIIGLALILATLYYLLRPNVRAYFSKARANGVRSSKIGLPS